MPEQAHFVHACVHGLGLTALHTQTVDGAYDWPRSLVSCESEGRNTNAAKKWNCYIDSGSFRLIV